ncbi:MAG: hypothetical protein LBH31_01030 [Burkholderiaceae bacterium]|jgi:hypothetical protein|nr:hypothetical protein [Burkholderiaceae bacterium]
MTNTTPLLAADQTIALSRTSECWMLAVPGFFMMVSPAAIDMCLPALPTVACVLNCL